MAEGENLLVIIDHRFLTRWQCIILVFTLSPFGDAAGMTSIKNKENMGKERAKKWLMKG
jgi:hypothetical protein